MLVPLRWLKNYVDINIDAQEYADKMTMTGSKVEAVDYLGEGIEKVVVGKILEINPHPDADKLIVTKVLVGNDETVQIVTGAKNVNVGDYIPVALSGAKLPGGIKIKKGKLRGEVSEGMMCSSEELGISAHMMPERKKDGIYIIDWADKLEEGIEGRDILEFLELDDYLIEFEITSNRPDCLSIMGIAKETAATIGVEVKEPSTEVSESGQEIEFKVDIKDADLCPRYAVRTIKDVKIEESPYWLQRRLIEANIRPINNIVDITNFVMIELGQPLHAFDMNKLASKEIIVRRAKENEIITTLDDVERKLDKEMLLITDSEKSVAIAGIMGAANSEIDENTTAIVLESANFNQDNVRLSSKRLGLRTEASSRFEKGIDQNLVEKAIDRAAHLIEMLGAGVVSKGSVDVYEETVTRKELTINPNRINKLLGEDLSIEEMIEILAKVEIEAVKESEDLLGLSIPTFRLDIHKEADILEEVARIYGYDNIKSKSIYGVSTLGIKTYRQGFEDRIKDVLTGLGLNEILTYSFVSPGGVDKINLPFDSEKREFIRLINPLGEETSVMRTTLLPNMLEVVYNNMSKKVPYFAGFELGNTFVKTDSEPMEKEKVSMALYGEVDFFNLKGAVEGLLQNVGLCGFEILPEKENTTFHPGRCAKVEYKGEYVGVFGEIHPDVNENYGFSERVYAAELDFDMIIKNVVKSVTYQPLAKYPGSSRDLAVVVKEEILVKEIEDIIKKNGKKLIEECSLFDIYKGEQIEAGYKSVAYSILYRSKERTLTDEDINPIQEKIVKEIEEKLEGKLRL